MKKVLFFILGIVVNFSIYGQSDMLKNGRIWSLLSIDKRLSPQHPIPTKGTSYLKVNGDTLINDTIYKKISFYSDSMLTKVAFSVGMREDSSRKVFLQHNSDKEILLYDFSMKSGDTVRYRTRIARDSETRIKIDSVYSQVIDNKTLKIFIVKYICIIDGIDRWKIDDIWIEDIGSIYGNFLAITCPIEDYDVMSYLLCVHDNSKLIYMNPAFNKCYIKDPPDNPIGIDLVAPTREAKLTFEDHILKISMHGYKNTKVDCLIYNMLGSLVYNYSFQNTGVPVSFNVAHLPVGIYVVQLVQKNQIIKNLKICK